MKKKLVFVLALAFTLAFGFNVFTANAGGLGLSYEAPQGTPVIDGAIDDVWDAAEWYNMNYVVNEIPNDISASFKALWDADNVYFLVKVDGPADVEPSSQIIVYLDESKSFQPAPYKADSRRTAFGFSDGRAIEGGFLDVNDVDIARINLAESSVQRTSDGNIYEIKLQLDTIKAAAGNDIGFEMQVTYNNDGGATSVTYRWNVDTNGGNTPPAQDTSNFGLLKFIAAAVESVPEETPPAEAPIEEPPAETPVTETPAEVPAETPAAETPVAPQNPITGVGLGGIIIASAMFLASGTGFKAMKRKH